MEINVTKKPLSERIFTIIKACIPKPIFRWLQPKYHLLLAHTAAFIYRYPSRKMLVVGITGTKGKTSTANFIWYCFTEAGYKTGLISSANFRFGSNEELNPFHMTMPGRFRLQKYLSRMVKEGCTHCVIEVTSEGLKQFRHRGIDFDAAVFTNLTPEHLPSHNESFEEYKSAKGLLFKALSSHPKKKLEEKLIPRTIIASCDTPHHKYFVGFPSDRIITYGLSRGDYQAVNLKVEGETGTTFDVGNESYRLNVWGKFQVANALAAIATAMAFDISKDNIKKALSSVRLIPGRMEKIDMGQDFIVLVDYAHEGASMNASLDAARDMAGPDKNVIVILGAEGGGRDKRKRPLMGDAAGRLANIVIVSPDDPYDEKPVDIIEDVARAVEKKGKLRERDLFTIEDRRTAIAKSLSLAKKGDVVLITGKGSEQSMFIYGKVIPWDDREVTREELNKLPKNQ
jgi:UDP-N-acetylmuramoyl-L-alanyl-D-glutamate--2,6-diaminopimelate ligase